MDMRLLIFVFMIMMGSISAYGQVEPVLGSTDKTVIWASDLTEVSSGEREVTINVISSDNNFEGDGDGGKISLQNAYIVRIEELDWEPNCRRNREFEYECIVSDSHTIQWFNFVFGDQDSFSFKVRFEKNGILTLEETGGMECGAYFQTAQHGPYRGYPDGSGGLPCTAPLTYLKTTTVEELGGFPVSIKLEDLVGDAALITPPVTDDNSRLILFFLGSSAVVLIGLIIFKIRRR